MPGVHMVAPKSLTMQELARTIEAGYWAKLESETHTPEVNSPDPISLPAWAAVQTTEPIHAEDTKSEQTSVNKM